MIEVEKNHALFFFKLLQKILFILNHYKKLISEKNMWLKYHGNFLSTDILERERAKSSPITHNSKVNKQWKYRLLYKHFKIRRLKIVYAIIYLI